MNKYVIEVNEEQLHIIQNALEGYTRAGTEQYDIMFEALTKYKHSYDVNQAINTAIRHLTECKLRQNESWGIHSEKIDDDYRVAYDMIQVLRNKQAWANAEDKEETRWNHGSKYMQISYDSPYPTTKKNIKLIKCEVVDE
jgi:effector-binding domain-containing protein